MTSITFLFAPGAGAPSSHPWIQHWTRKLSRIGRVKILDYPYMIEGRKSPDRLPKLIAAHLAALKKIKRSPNTKIVLIGKSMGSRVGCHVSLEAKVHRVVCLGYPLCGGGDPKKLRDAVLLEMRTPVLFVQGTRDSLCPLSLLAKVRRRMSAPSKLVKVKDGDHSLSVARRELKASGTTQAVIDDKVLAEIARFAGASPPCN